MLRTKMVLIGAALLVLTGQANAVAVASSDPPWSTERIERLPPEIRRVVVAKCGAYAEAGHYFVTYDHDSNVIRLDYSLLQCPGVHVSGNGRGREQETFVRHGGRYFPSYGHRDEHLFLR
jgi:hypothetical protein